MSKHNHHVALYVDPPSHHFLGDRLFNANDGRMNGDHVNLPYAHLHDVFTAAGIEIHTADYLPPENIQAQIVYVSTGILTNYKRLAQRKDTVLGAYFALECPVVEPTMFTAMKTAQHFFKRIYTFSDGASLEPFIGATVPLKLALYPQAYNLVHENIWSRTDRKFLVMINSNKRPRIYRQELYTERLRAIEFFAGTGEFDLFGVGWDVPAYQMGRTWMPYTLQRIQRKLQAYQQRIWPDHLLETARRVYHGQAQSKSETLGQYTFSLVIENMEINGWITEKMFDCFYAGTVPIYRGAPDISSKVPPDCFIDMRRFPSYQELYEYLKSLAQTDIQQYKENARDFLHSEKFRPFSKEAFVEIFCQIVAEDTGIQIR